MSDKRRNIKTNGYCKSELSAWTFDLKSRRNQLDALDQGQESSWLWVAWPWVLGIEMGSSAKAASALTQWAMSSAQEFRSLTRYVVTLMNRRNMKRYLKNEIKKKNRERKANYPEKEKNSPLPLPFSTTWRLQGRTFDYCSYLKYVKDRM